MPFREKSPRLRLSTTHSEAAVTITIDTHIHLFDKTRPEGAPYPFDMPGGGEPQEGMIALPNRYKAVVSPLGVAGAIVVEASPRLEDNQWLLDQAAGDPIIVGVVGSIDLAGSAFPDQLDRFVANRLFLGIRQYRLESGVDNAEYIAHIKRRRNADGSLDVDIPRHAPMGPEVVHKILQKVPSLRLVLDHLPDSPYHIHELSDAATRQKYIRTLEDIGQNPLVYIKLSEVVHREGNNVPTDI